MIGVFLASVVLFTLLQKPHSRCDSQMELLKKSALRWLIPKSEKGVTRPSLYTQYLENCKLGMGTLGACYKYLEVLKKFVTELQNVSPECGPELLEIPEAKLALNEGLRTLVTMAWGEVPPEPKAPVAGRLESPDLALFCALREDYLRFAGAEAWEQLKINTLTQLPGEAKIFQSAPGQRTICLNCDNIKGAIKAFGGTEQALVRSLFALRCEFYR